MSSRPVSTNGSIQRFHETAARRGRGLRGFRPQAPDRAEEGDVANRFGGALRRKCLARLLGQRGVAVRLPISVERFRARVPPECAGHGPRFALRDEREPVREELLGQARGSRGPYRGGFEGGGVVEARRERSAKGKERGEGESGGGDSENGRKDREGPVPHRDDRSKCPPAAVIPSAARDLPRATIPSDAGED